MTAPIESRATRTYPMFAESAARRYGRSAARCVTGSSINPSNSSASPSLRWETSASIAQFRTLDSPPAARASPRSWPASPTTTIPSATPRWAGPQAAFAAVVFGEIMDGAEAERVGLLVAERTSALIASVRGFLDGSADQDLSRPRIGEILVLPAAVVAVVVAAVARVVVHVEAVARGRHQQTVIATLHDGLFMQEVQKAFQPVRFLTELAIVPEVA